jgi:hypothetical protein
MDPYLEGPLWSTVHSNLIEEIARQLAPRLRPKYLALTNQRIVVAAPDPLEAPPQSRFPDVGVYSSSTPAGQGGAALLTAPLIMSYVLPEEQPQTFLEIRDAAQHRLVTSLEVLSPTNKRGDGLADFRKKRYELLASDAHYVEIDLLRVGERFPVVGILPSVPYFVFLSRVPERPRVEVWPIRLDQPLPEILIPLLPGDSDVQLDLQSALNTVYELFGYDVAANHQGDPPAPLAPEWSEWATARLRVAGIIE